MAFGILVSPPWLCQVLLQQRLRRAVGSTRVCQLSLWPGRILAEHMGSVDPKGSSLLHPSGAEPTITEPGHGGCAQVSLVTVVPPWQQGRCCSPIS